MVISLIYIINIIASVAGEKTPTIYNSVILIEHHKNHKFMQRFYLLNTGRCGNKATICVTMQLSLSIVNKILVCNAPSVCLGCCFNSIQFTSLFPSMVRIT